MTCIVGIVDNDTVYIGGDRGASDNESIVSLAQPKVFVNGDWLIGYSGNIGNGQLLQFITLPAVGEDDDPFKLLRLDIVEELKSAIDSFGTEPDENNETDILVGCKGRLFEMTLGEWGVAEVTETAIGSGGTFALGSLFSTKDTYTNPMIRMTYALNAAITYSPTCQGPMDILYI